ncbi:MAG: hypothetical protein GY867_09375 [bacterium]|nr:hypothetical protein [bacterium]
MRLTRLILLVAGLLAVAGTCPAQNGNGIDPEALIERILAVDQQQRSQIRDLVFDAEYVEREDKGDEGFKEKIRFVKKIYVKYIEDTAWFHEEYLEFYKDGKLKSQKDLQNEARDRKEKKKKRKGRDISYSMLKPFYPENRELYNIEYLGVAEERIEDRVCHLFRVMALEENELLINGDFYFEAESFHLVRAEFTPAKLVKKMMFKLKEMDLSIVFGPNDKGFWLPQQFDVRGKGKAAFFFGVNFAGTEYFRNPVVNGGVDESLFEAQEDGE